MPDIDPQMQRRPLVPTSEPSLPDQRSGYAIETKSAEHPRREGKFCLQSPREASYGTRLAQNPGPECAMTMQVVSVVGALMVLIAYGLIQAGTWRELDAGYLALNIIGSLLLGIVAIEDRRVGFVLLEFAWAGIALIGVARAVRAKRRVRA